MARLFLVLLLAAGPAGAAPETADEVRACMRRNALATSAEQVISFRAHDRIGAVTESRARLYWKKADDGTTKAMVQMQEPADMKGVGLLILERGEGQQDLFVYMPDMGKVRRLNKRAQNSSLFGTDFSYEQFEQIQGFYEDAKFTRRDDAEVAGRAVFVIESHPEPDPETGIVSDGHSVFFVDKETCVTLKAEFYEKGDRLRRVLEVDPNRITVEGGTHVPRLLVMRDLRDETRTELTVEEIELGKEISDRRFTQRALERGR